MAERHLEQGLDLQLGLPAGEAVVQFELDQAKEERVQRRACCQDLLGDLAERCSSSIIDATAATWPLTRRACVPADRRSAGSGTLLT